MNVLKGLNRWLAFRDPRVWRWIFYDWAEAAFATTVMVAFFPILLTHYWSPGSPALALARLGIASGTAALAIALVAPLLGALADRAQARAFWLVGFAGLGILSVLALDVVGRGQWALALLLFGLALVGYSGGNVFYNSLLLHWCHPADIDRVSCYGYGAGYLGGGLLFAVNIWMVTDPARFGLANALIAMRVAFVDVALWWGLFTLPILFGSEGIRTGRPGLGSMLHSGWQQFRSTFREVRKLRYVSAFLLAYWCYIDGVNTIIKMAVSYGLTLGFPSSSLIVAILLTQAVAFPAALAYASLGARWGVVRALYLGIGVYMVATVAAVFMTDVAEFYILAGVVGLVQGGTQALSRSLYTRLIPREKSAEFFGFYGMIGKFSAILGPFLVALTESWTGNVRLAIGSIIVLFAAGALLLGRVDFTIGQMVAESL